MKTKLFKALLGFAAGVFISPLAVVACPFILAYVLFTMDDDDDCPEA